MKRIVGIVIALAAIAGGLNAQISGEVTPAQKTRQANRSKPPEYAIGPLPTRQTEVSVLRGRLSAVDVATRSLTIESQDGTIRVTFVQPEGLEKLRLDKRLTKKGGNREIPFEQLRAGWEVKALLYPAVGAISELTVLAR